MGKFGEDEARESARGKVRRLARVSVLAQGVSLRIRKKGRVPERQEIAPHKEQISPALL
jgi:hypothetical protein